MLTRSKRALLALMFIAASLGIGGAAVFRSRAAANARKYRSVHTAALLHALAGPVAMSSAEVPVNGTDEILSVLEMSGNELENLLLMDLNIKEGRILDMWGNPVRLVLLGDGLALVSCGPNTAYDAGKQDDIVKRLVVRRSSGRNTGDG